MVAVTPPKLATPLETLTLTVVLEAVVSKLPNGSCNFPVKLVMRGEELAV